MADCNFCGEPLITKNTQFCNKQCEKLWSRENGGHPFSTGDYDTPDIVEGRKARMREFERLRPLACHGDREARAWMWQTLRLTAIWDNDKKTEVRLK